MNHYWGFGLNIASEIDFPELLPHDSEHTDVQFLIGNVPADIEGENLSTKLFEYKMNAREFLFTVRDVARYYASDGQTIIIEPVEPLSEMRSIRLYVLATVMAATLLQRNVLPVHASAIRQQHSLTLITGDSKAGKSTTVAGLLRKGYTLFSDDVVVMRQNEASNVQVAASYPMVKLWDDTLVKMDDPRFDRSFRIQKGLDKYGYFFHDRFDTDQYSVNTVIVLRVRDQVNLSFRKLEGQEAFGAMVSQIYRPMLVQNTTQKLLCFQLFSEVVKNVRILEVCRPPKCEAYQLVDFVENLL